MAMASPLRPMPQDLEAALVQLFRDEDEHRRAVLDRADVIRRQMWGARALEWCGDEAHVHATPSEAIQCVVAGGTAAFDAWHCGLLPRARDWFPRCDWNELARAAMSAEAPPLQAECESHPETLLYNSLQAIGIEPLAQYRVGRYRLDFAIGPDDTRLAIEVDGYAYHRSRSRFEHDRKRDRTLAREGWIVLRFAAVEVIRDASACAAQVLDIIGAIT